jgi:hypothetical protein
MYFLVKLLAGRNVIVYIFDLVDERGPMILYFINYTVADPDSGFLVNPDPNLDPTFSDKKFKKANQKNALYLFFRSLQRTSNLPKKPPSPPPALLSSNMLFCKLFHLPGSGSPT